jgi:glutamine amidotransferase
MLIAIVNYGLGNLTSVAGAVHALGFEPTVTSDPEIVAGADCIILPGVGAFGDGMRMLRDAGMVQALDRARKICPILGICLGAQMLCRSSEEFGLHEGLGWIDAEVKLLRPVDPALAVPHVGWDNFARTRASFLFDGVPENALFYYVHSYAIHCRNSSQVIGSCEYGESFAAAVATDRVYGVQFHPEKSQKHGLKLLNNFIAGAA